MNRTYNIISYLFFSLLIALISLGCAQQGAGALVGGDKDEAPPVPLESTPENFSTNFTGQDFVFVFDEYFTLKELNQKLLISPPMAEKPEIKVKGKKLLIHFPMELLPDRTYTLNFGDALVDLNESNPIPNFMVVFSTGNEIDSLEMQGRIVDAFSGEPVEGVAVMLYALDSTGGDQEALSGTDSLPLTELPLYLSRTDKEGKFHLKNLAGGGYKMFALLDGNNNYLYDQPSEKIAFLDSIVEGFAPRARVQVQDSIVEMEVDSTINLEQKEVPDTVSVVEPRETLSNRQYLLRLFAESPPRQYIKATSREQAGKMQLIFNEPLDSLDMKLLYHDDREWGLLFEWSTGRDSLLVWAADSLLGSRDSLVFEVGYYVYDSLEQKKWETDTLKFSFRPSAAKKEEKSPMTIQANVGRTMDLGSPLMLSMGLPVLNIDTNKISLFRIRDSLEFSLNYRIQTPARNVYIPGLDSGMLAQRKVIIERAFLQDSSYSLRIMPGAFTGYLGFTNDSLKLDFTLNNKEKYGSLVMKIDSLQEPAILQLTGSKDEVLAERRIDSSSTERFELLKPGKYKFKMILDKNNNGKWDTGIYMKKIQPEQILYYNKEITLKANWEMEENWIIELQELKNP